MRRTEVLQWIRLMKFEEISERTRFRELSQGEAASVLGVSERTFRRWRVRFEAEGALSVMLVLFVKRSRLGQAIRATAQNARAARIMGIDTGRVYAATYALNAAVCGAAGALVAMVWAIELYLGLIFTISSFMIVIVAGLGNLAGVVAAGVGLGAVENFAGFTLGTEFQVAFVFGLLVVILVGRSALLARQRRPRVSIKSPLPGPAVPDAYIFIYWVCRMAAASAWPRAASALARARAWS